ncbi:hypothetical protein ACFFN7_18080 [Haloarcula sebkhae]|uniref:Uncharacterized protein n=1 Tax=Haloarcula sebkhae TaxID=932660 RepID=A0ACC6VQ17_9EURY
MPTCQGCGSTVTDQYVQVFTPDGVDQPRVCPFCEDRVRDGAGFARRGRLDTTTVRSRLGTILKRATDDG